MKYQSMGVLPLLLAALGAPAQTATSNPSTAVEQASAERARSEAQLAEAAARQASGLAERDAARAARDAERAARDAARAARSLQKAPTDQEQLAIAALEGLIAAPPERALPLLKRVLDGQQTELVKMRALFVLSQIDTPPAQQLLLGSAKQSTGELRLEALRMIGIGGNEQSLAALAQIYQSGDRDVRNAVLQAYLMAGRKAEIAALARSADNPDDAREAIQMLGAMGALAELRQLSDLAPLSDALVQAYAIAGDLESLRGMANGKDAQARVDAVRSIGLISDAKAGAALREIYQSSKDSEVRAAALQALMIQGNQTVLLEIYRASSDPKDKQAVLRQLTLTGGEAALEAIDAALQGQKP